MGTSGGTELKFEKISQCKQRVKQYSLSRPRDKVQNTQLRERQIALALCLSHSFKNLLLNLAVLAAHPKQGSGHIIGRLVSKLVCILTVSSHRGGALYCVHTGIQGL
jgi:hypothetical protein